MFAKRLGIVYSAITNIVQQINKGNIDYVSRRFLGNMLVRNGSYIRKMAETYTLL